MNSQQNYLVKKLASENEHCMDLLMLLLKLTTASDLILLSLMRAIQVLIVKDMG